MGIQLEKSKGSQVGLRKESGSQQHGRQEGSSQRSLSTARKKQTDSPEEHQLGRVSQGQEKIKKDIPKKKK